ncbi:MAG: hypothetical protein EBR99_04720, partial [Actinobacteria bacterium]|nr:hypothetical protein [Actinomycetota bacterium]
DATTTPAAPMGITNLQAYVTSADTAWASTDNVKLVNNAAAPVYTLGGTRTINSLNIQSTTTAITVNNTALTLVSGGLLSNGAANNTLASGTLTAGSGSAAELFILDNANLTITAQVIDNGSGSITLIKGLGGTTTLSPTVSNTYSGSTIVNAGTLTFGSAAGITTIPGNLVVNNAAVTFTQLQQIASGKALTINGAGGNVTFAGTGNNVLGAVSFVNNGGYTTPQITGGTVVMTSLAAQNDNLSATPTVASTVNLNGSNLTVTPSGLSVVDLIVSGSIVDNTASSSTGLVKAGAGSLVLSATGSTFGGGVALNVGTLILDASSTPTSGSVTSGPLGVGALTMAGGTTLMGGTATRTLANTVNVQGNVEFGGPVSTNNLTLSGVVALGTSARTFTLASPNNTLTLSGTITGTQVLTKTGLGALAISGGTANYAPGFALSAGSIVLDNTSTAFSAAIATSAGATVSLSPAASGSVGVTVNPSGTPLAVSGSGQMVKTGATATAYVLNLYGNFSYTGPTTVQSGSLLLTPNAVTNAAPTFGGTSMVNLSIGGATFGLDNAGATGSISVGTGAIPINFLARDTTISTTRNADFASTLTLSGAISRAAGATGVFNFINNVGFQPSADDSIFTSNKIVVGGSSGVINPGIFVTSGNNGNTLLRTDFAYRDSAGFVRNVGYGVDAGTTLSGGSAVSASGGNFKFTG